MMKPKRIRVTEANSEFFIEGKIYNVEDWMCGRPHVIDEEGDLSLMTASRWEPVQDFQHGDPVWAWDDDETDKSKVTYIGAYPNSESHVVYIENKGVTVFKHVEHRKSTITIEELAEKANINLNDYEVIT